jgi:hypothetical protein
VSVSIKPPGGTSGPGAVGLDDVASVQRGTTSAVEHAAGAGAASEVQSPTAALLGRLDAGEITREQAIDGMVEEALGALGAARLPPAQRAELEGVLRAALADDPTLNKLIG